MGTATPDDELFGSCIAKAQTAPYFFMYTDGKTYLSEPLIREGIDLCLLFVGHTTGPPMNNK